jgi:hypothetical protein
VEFFSETARRLQATIDPLRDERETGKDQDQPAREADPGKQGRKTAIAALKIEHRRSEILHPES